MSKIPKSDTLTLFRKRRESGAESMFGSAQCPGCGGEMPRGFDYCSGACQTKVEVTMPELAKYEEKLVQLIGKRVRLETKAGSVFHGKLTGIDATPLFINGTAYKLPAVVVLDNDGEKSAEVSQLKLIEEV